jgi:hypothetical protein
MRLRRVVVARIKTNPIRGPQFSMIDERPVEATAGAAPASGMPRRRKNRQIGRPDGTGDAGYSGCHGHDR